MDTGSFPEVRSGRGVTLTPHPLLVQWSRKNRAIPLLPLWAVRPVQSLSACTRVHFTFFTPYIQYTIILNVHISLLVLSPYVASLMLGHGLLKICLDVLNRDCKPAKSDYQLCHNCPFDRPYGTNRLHCTDLHEIWYLSIFQKSVKKIQVWLINVKLNFTLEKPRMPTGK